MAAVPPIRELERLCGGEGRAPGERLTVRIAYARLVRRLSIRITWLLLHTPLRANQVTVAGIVIGLLGAALAAWNDAWAMLAGVVALQLSFVMDFSDGEMARYQGSSDAGGAYLDWIGHYYVPAAVSAALAYGAFEAGGSPVLFLLALVLVLGQVRVPFSARDHVLLGLYRDRPELRDSPELVRAVLARQGGDPDEIDPDASYAGRREGATGRGLLWKRFTNVGQLLVFPGFINLVTLGLAVEVGLSLDQLPQVDSSTARTVLLAGLALVQLLHQLRAAAQSHAVLERLK